MAEVRPNPELLRALGRLVRGLSGLFWGLPLALVVCVQTSRGDFLRPLNVFPPLLAHALLVYALSLLEDFQKQERVWRSALERTRALAVVNLGFSPFLFWWSRIPSQPLYNIVVWFLMIGGLFFLFSLNPLLCRLTAMLPDEALRAETRLFTQVNRWLIGFTLAITLGYFAIAHSPTLPASVHQLMSIVDSLGLWLLLFFILLPLAMTMALIWKIKEVILAGVFGGGT